MTGLPRLAQYSLLRYSHKDESGRKRDHETVCVTLGVINCGAGSDANTASLLQPVGFEGDFAAGFCNAPFKLMRPPVDQYKRVRNVAVIRPLNRGTGFPISGRSIWKTPSP